MHCAAKGRWLGLEPAHGHMECGNGEVGSFPGSKQEHQQRGMGALPLLDCEDGPKALEAGLQNQ